MNVRTRTRIRIMKLVNISVLALLAISLKVCYAQPGSQNCVQVAESFPEPMPGGWFEHDMPEEQFAELANMVIERHNQISDDICQYAVNDGGRLKSFSQVVAGTNYCIQFIGNGKATEGTKSGSSNDSCAAKTVTCTSKVYRPFSGPHQINELECI